MPPVIMTNPRTGKRSWVLGQTAAMLSAMTNAQLAAYRAGQTCAAFANIRLATDKEIARRKGVESYEWPVRRAG